MLCRPARIAPALSERERVIAASAQRTEEASDGPQGLFEASSRSGLARAGRIIRQPARRRTLALPLPPPRRPTPHLPHGPLPARAARHRRDRHRCRRSVPVPWHAVAVASRGQQALSRDPAVQAWPGLSTPGRPDSTGPRAPPGSARRPFPPPAHGAIVPAEHGGRQAIPPPAVEERRAARRPGRCPPAGVAPDVPRRTAEADDVQQPTCSSRRAADAVHAREYRGCACWC